MSPKHFHNLLVGDSQHFQKLGSLWVSILQKMQFMHMICTVVMNNVVQNFFQNFKTRSI